jgi:ATP-dependent exoDNAse (exonuclease V) beta subunit
MKNISYTSAGAGSGKTYKLTHLLADLIIKDGVEPEQIILTTFTNDAAAELRERAKAVLVENGKYEKAMRLDQAIIGTIHSMAQQFVQKYWYLLGISSELNVISEDDTEFFISQSLAKLPTDDDIKFFNEFVDYFNISKKKEGGRGNEKNYNFWKDELKSIIEKSRSYDITDYDLSRDESKKWLSQFVVSGSKVNMTDADWDDVIKEMHSYNGFSNTDKPKIESLLRNAKSRTFNWLVDFYFLFIGIAEKHKKACPLCMNACDEVAKIFGSKEIFDRQAQYIDIIFRLAEKWQGVYVEYKKAHQLIDFNDMEMYLIRLLTEHEDVLAEIGHSYRYLFVDEFQDSSLSQVKIFSILSDVMEKTYFVGDEKQAIYSFRGGNPALIKAVTDYIASGINNCKKELPLDTSRRSTPEIVQVVNHVFIPLFCRYGMTKEDIELKPWRKTVFGPDTLRYWTYPGSKCDDFYMAIGGKIHEMKINGEIENYADVAILGYSKEELNSIANAIKSLGIPVNRGSGNIKEYDETELLFAVLSILQNKKDTLSKIKIAYLTEPGWTLNHIIDDRLDYNERVRLAGEEGRETCVSALDNVELVKQTLALDASIKRMSVASIVESVIIQLRLADVVKRMNMPEQRIANLYALSRYAQMYEDHCVTMAQAATIDGFMDYIQLGDLKADGDPKGVNIKTYHSSKGLQWKVVILTSLNKSFASDNDIISKQIYGVQVQYQQTPTKDNFFPDCFITVKPWIMGTKESLPTDYTNIVLNSQLFRDRMSATIQENTRLMYVGMTRARDMMVLVGQGKNAKLKWFEQLGVNTDSDSPNCLGTGDVFSKTDIAKPEYDVLVKEQEQHMAKYECLEKDYSPRNIQPSADHSDLGDVTELTGSSKINRIAGKVEEGNEAEVGNCIHQIYCDIDCENPSEMARDIILQRMLTTQLLDPDALIDSYRHLEVLLTENFGEAIKKERELQFKQFVDEHIINGSIDLVWNTAKGAVIVDYKTFQGKPEYVLDKEYLSVYAGRYRKQLNYYAEALKADGRKVIATLIYYPVTGVLIKVD